MNTKKNIIVLIEDNDEDYEMTRYAFNKSNLSNELIRFSTGDEAVEHLTKNDATLSPEVILLDLNLPGLDGRDVLQILKSNDATKKIPIVVLTTSKDEKDIERCYEYGANSYIQKPVDFDKFIESIKMLHEFWFEVSIIPKK